MTTIGHIKPVQVYGEHEDKQQAKGPIRTNAEYCKAYRERKKRHEERRRPSRLLAGPKTQAARSKAHRERKKQQQDFELSRSTNRERCKAYRERKKAEGGHSESQSERCKAYRARKKLQSEAWTEQSARCKMYQKCKVTAALLVEEETSCPLKAIEDVWFRCCFCNFVTTNQRVMTNHLIVHGEQMKYQHWWL